MSSCILLSVVLVSPLWIDRLPKFVEVAYTCLVGYMFCYDFLNQHCQIRLIREMFIFIWVLGVKVRFLEHRPENGLFLKRCQSARD